MKVIGIILSFYIAYLVCYPCMDSQSCWDEQRVGIAVVDVQDHDHQEGEQDFCSPFCICSCCSTQIQQPSYFYFDARQEGASVLNGVLRQAFVKPFANTIWQPPKI